MLGRRDRRLSDRARGGLLSIFCSKVWDSYFIKLFEFHILLFFEVKYMLKGYYKEIDKGDIIGCL